MNTLEDFRNWAAQMRRRSFRQFELQGSTPAGWHVLLPGGDFGFLDVTVPATADAHAILVQEARDYMREMRVSACVFAMERELLDGRPVLYFQFEACDRRGKRERSRHLHRIVSERESRHVDDLHELTPEHERDADLLQFGLFPDLLPEPPSPLRIL